VESAEPRHLDVHEHDIRGMTLNRCYGCIPVDTLAHQLDALRVSEGTSHRAARECLIINDPYTDGRRNSSADNVRFR
jgi:hypothetical protein